jgi:hypothetical protein
MNNEDKERAAANAIETSSQRYQSGGSDNDDRFSISHADGRNCAHRLKVPSGQTIYPVTADVRRPLGRKCK